MTVRILSVASLCLMACCASAPKARSFAELRSELRPGQTVSVTDATGATVEGRVERIGADSLFVLAGAAHHEFSADRVTRVQRQTRRPGTGALVGLGVGFGVGLVAARSQEPSYSPAADVAAAGGNLFGGMLFGTVLGAGVGTFVHSFRTVYERPNASPALPPTPQLVHEHGPLDDGSHRDMLPRLKHR